MPVFNFLASSGSVHLPKELQGIVEAVLGLDNRPEAAPHCRMRSPGETTVRRQRLTNGRQPRHRLAFTPLQVAALYDFPAGTGKGVVHRTDRGRRRLPARRSDDLLLEDQRHRAERDRKASSPKSSLRKHLAVRSSSSVWWNVAWMHPLLPNSVLAEVPEV